MVLSGRYSYYILFGNFDRLVSFISCESVDIFVSFIFGHSRLWNTWTLEHIADIKDEACQLPIVR